MRKHRLQDIVLGMVLMALVMGLAVPALAAVTTRTLNANYMDIKIVVDGAPITPTDVNGNLVEPFAVDGTTYLPVRAVGEALGKEVTWDGNTNTVYVGEVPPGAIKNWVGVANSETFGILGGFYNATANELPNAFKAIEETGARVNPRGRVGGGPLEVVLGFNTEPFALVDDYEEDEVRIEGLHFYLGESCPYKTIVRGMLQDVISDPADVNSIMGLVEKADELFATMNDRSAGQEEKKAANRELENLFSVDLTFDEAQVEFKSEHIYQFNCVSAELKVSNWPYYHADLIIKNK